MSELVIFPLKMTPDDRDELKEVARLENRDAADLVRDLLTDYMRERSAKFTGKVSEGDKRKRPNAGRPRKKAV